MNSQEPDLLGASTLTNPQLPITDTSEALESAKRKASTHLEKGKEESKISEIGKENEPNRVNTIASEEGLLHHAKVSAEKALGIGGYTPGPSPTVPGTMGAPTSTPSSGATTSYSYVPVATPSPTPTSKTEYAASEPMPTSSFEHAEGDDATLKSEEVDKKPSFGEKIKRVAHHAKESAEKAFGMGHDSAGSKSKAEAQSTTKVVKEP